MKEGEVGILSRSTFRQWANHQPFTRAISVLVNQMYYHPIPLITLPAIDLLKILPFQHTFITFWYAHDFQSHKPAVCILKKAEHGRTKYLVQRSTEANRKCCGRLFLAGWMSEDCGQDTEDVHLTAD